MRTNAALMRFWGLLVTFTLAADLDVADTVQTIDTRQTGAGRRGRRSFNSRGSFVVAVGASNRAGNDEAEMDFTAKELGAGLNSGSSKAAGACTKDLEGNSRTEGSRASKG